MNNPTIIIFAAGTGSRLGFNIPKALIDFNGKKLIEYQLDEINKTFPESHIIIVGGYKIDKLKEFVLDDYNADKLMNIHIVENKNYTSSILYSFDTSVKYAKENNISLENVIRLDGDVFLFDNSLKNLRLIAKTTFFSTVCDKETDTVILKGDDWGNLLNFEYVKGYIGDNEWSCVEYYFNNDYHKYWKGEIKETSLNQGGHYYTYLEQITELLKPKIAPIFNIFEIDTLADLEKVKDLKSKRYYNERKVKYEINELLRPISKKYLELIKDLTHDEADLIAYKILDKIHTDLTACKLEEGLRRNKLNRKR